MTMAVFDDNPTSTNGLEALISAGKLFVSFFFAQCLLRVCVCMCVHVHMCIHVCVLHMCMYMCMYVCVCACLRDCVLV